MFHAPADVIPTNRDVVQPEIIAVAERDATLTHADGTDLTLDLGTLWPYAG